MSINNSEVLAEAVELRTDADERHPGSPDAGWLRRRRRTPSSPRVTWRKALRTRLAALLAARGAAHLPADLPVRADARQRHRVPPVPAGRQHVRRRVGRACATSSCSFNDPTVLAGVHQHADPRRTDAADRLPAADPARAAAQRGALRAVQADSVQIDLVPAALHVDRDRRRHGLAADGAVDGIGQPGHRVRSAATRSRSCSSRSGSARSTCRSEVWQTVGWGTILYLAALTTIDEQLYEAARIDGANRLAADLARHAARHPPDDDRAAHPQHRHVHGGRASRRSCCSTTR